VRTLFLLAFLALAGAARAQGGVYAGYDDDGTLHLTDRPPSREYRLVSGAAAGLAEAVAGAAMRFGDEVREAAVRHGVDPLLVHAVIRAESAYNPRAVSPKGAVGLMQLMPETARRFDVADRFDPRMNLEGGTRYLRELIAQFGGNLELALAAYNAGESAVLRAGGRVPAIRETVDYVRRVQRHYRELAGRGA